MDYNNNPLIQATNLGYFIIKGGFWGFLLKMETVQEIYTYQVDDTLEGLLKTRLFQFMFRKFAYFVLSDSNDSSVLKVSYHVK